MTEKSFRSKVLELRPDVVESKANNDFKRQLAMALRALRKNKGLTQGDIESRSSLTQPMISRLEAPTGPLPNWDTVVRYVEACEAHMLVGFSPHEFNEHNLGGSTEEAAEDVVFAVAV
jgi:transcriptional regulator with XRE-family HTH domain